MSSADFLLYMLSQSHGATRLAKPTAAQQSSGRNGSQLHLTQQKLIVKTKISFEKVFADQYRRPFMLYSL